LIFYCLVNEIRNSGNSCSFFNFISMQQIKNIIFDLGGVILNIDIKLTEQALVDLGIDNLSQQGTMSHLPSFFREYEAGKMDDVLFIQSVKGLSAKTLTDEEVINAWNALLLDFPQERLDLLRSLKERYRLFLLSNTNSIHQRKFQQDLHTQTGVYLEDFFEKTYYSHTAGLCKPDTAIFKLVITENNLNPAETLFVDDTESNVTGAKEAGLQVAHIIPGRSIMDIEW
jgi:glucose-1-phosphatase